VSSIELEAVLDDGDHTVPITEEQWTRILAGRTRRCRALLKPEQLEWAGKRAVSCGSCSNTKLSGDPRRGFCTAQRHMVSLTFLKLCRDYEPA
jgi:hypothetical protein